MLKLISLKAATVFCLLYSYYYQMSAHRSSAPPGCNCVGLWVCSMCRCGCTEWKYRGAATCMHNRVWVCFIHEWKCSCYKCVLNKDLSWFKIVISWKKVTWLPLSVPLPQSPHTQIQLYLCLMCLCPHPLKKPGEIGLILLHTDSAELHEPGSYNILFCT